MKLRKKTTPETWQMVKWLEKANPPDKLKFAVKLCAVFERELIDTKIMLKASENNGFRWLKERDQVIFERDNLLRKLYRLSRRKRSESKKKTSNS